MLILAFDASTPVVTVAVGRAEAGGREVLAEVSSSAGGASELLLPSVNAALEISGEKLENVGRIVVGVGPGTFTGIRIAVATARALSKASGTPVAANSTLRTLAAPALSLEPEVLAVLDARRNQIFAQRFSGFVQSAGKILCTKPDGLEAGGSPLAVGGGAVRYRGTLPGPWRVPPDDSPLHRVTAAGHVLSAELSPAEPEGVVPIYVREPDAEVRRDLNPWSS